MIFKRLMRVSLVTLAAMIGLNANTTNVDLASARSIASSFLKLRTAVPGAFNAPALADLKLAHAEASSVDKSANAYYAFNIDGGGFVIISGDDRASQVLGFSDKGRIDFANMPDNLRALLDGYKRQIEYLQLHPSTKVASRRISENSEIIVEPLIKTEWGQQMPYFLQCPTYQGQHCKVGCSGVQMAQILYYWQYPTTCGPIASYTCSMISTTLEELPVTTFDYSKMLHSYCHWDYDLGETVQDDYTEEQVQEVAKLCRYVGQAAKVSYSLSSSFTNGSNKLAGMKKLGYNPNAKSLSYTSSYTTESWERLMRAELDAGRPIMYGAKHVGTASTSHAFIFDGYDNNGYFHINFGWYGVNNGWFLTTAIITTTLDGSYRDYGSNHYMFTNMEPPEYCKVIAKDIDAEGGLLLLGGLLQPRASRVNLYTTYSDVDLSFALTDQEGNRVATSDLIHVVKNDFVQRSDIYSTITLPTTMADGTYDLQFNYLVNGTASTIDISQGKLIVIGKFAKYNAPFNIEDVTTAIDYLLNGTAADNVELSIDDVIMLIDHILTLD